MQSITKFSLISFTGVFLFSVIYMVTPRVVYNSAYLGIEI